MDQEQESGMEDKVLFEIWKAQEEARRDHEALLEEFDSMIEDVMNS